MLDVATRALTHITGTHDLATLYSTSFSPDGRHILACWDDCAGYRLDVHDRSGERVAQISSPDTWRKASLAFAAQNRVAGASREGFSVWDLTSGELHGTRGPREPQVPRERCRPCGSRAGVVAANKAGSKLAFSEGRGLSPVPVFDAVTLDALGCLLPAHDYVPLSDHGAFSSMTWDVYGLLFTCPPTERKAGVLRVVSPDARSDTAKSYCEIMRCQQQHAHKPVSSPDGAFVCVCESDGAEVKIYDTRSGRLVLDSCVPLPDSLEVLHKPVLWWSACGCCVLVRHTTWDAGARRCHPERLLWMQILRCRREEDAGN